MGKYVQHGDKTEMTLDLTVNHALADGGDIVEAFELIQQLSDKQIRLVGTIG